MKKKKKKSRKGRKRVDIVGVKQAVLQRKKGRGREREDARALSRRAFLISVGYLL